MTDLEIESGLVRRDEEALLSLQDRYGAYCFSIALRLLRDEELARECVSDVYLGVWNADKPPRNLKAYLAKAVRNTALHYIERSRAQKRSANLVLLDELAECLPDPGSEGELENRLLKDCLNRFVRSLRQEERQLFLLRYWYGYSLSELAQMRHCSEGRIASLLHRTRGKLKKMLEKEGFHHG